VTTSVIERMENSLKHDLIRELRAGNGRVLVHDEIEDPPGNFTITALWETIAEEDVMTPRDVFELMKSEGYRVDYGRVAIVRPFQIPADQTDIATVHYVDGRTGAVAGRAR
jgi:hypothetical protein